MTTEKQSFDAFMFWFKQQDGLDFKSASAAWNACHMFYQTGEVMEQQIASQLDTHHCGQIDLRSAS